MGVEEEAGTLPGKTWAPPHCDVSVFPWRHEAGVGGAGGAGWANHVIDPEIGRPPPSPPPPRWGSVPFLSALTQMGCEPFELVNRPITRSRTRAFNGKKHRLLPHASARVDIPCLIDPAQNAELTKPPQHVSPESQTSGRPLTCSHSTDPLVLLSLHHANNRANHAAECSHLDQLSRHPRESWVRVSVKCRLMPRLTGPSSDW